MTTAAAETALDAPVVLAVIELVPTQPHWLGDSPWARPFRPGYCYYVRRSDGSKSSFGTANGEDWPDALKWAILSAARAGFTHWVLKGSDARPARILENHE